MMKRQREEILWTITVMVFILAVFLYGIGRIYGFSLFPDEFGYWASAAKAIGYDWSAISSLGSYYSFGYSLILIPILCVFQDALWAYRAAVAVNAGLLLVSFLLLNNILRKLLPELRSGMRILFSGIAVCYPTWFLYMNMTLTEIVLVFAFLLVCFFLQRYLEKMDIRDLLLTATSTVYLYTVHMRTVAIALAVVVTVIIRIVTKKGENPRRALKHLLLAGLVLAIGIMVVAVGKHLVQTSVYSGADTAVLANNDYSGQWEKVRSLFTLRGSCDFIVSLLGKVFYLGMASFGLFYYGVAWIIQKIADRRVRKEKRCFYLFILLAVIGQILVCAVYTKGYGRIDGLLYGRYDENILPVVMAFGCTALVSMKRPHWILTGVIGAGIPVVVMIEHVIAKYQMTNLHEGYFISGMSYLLRYISFEPENYFWKAYVLACIFCLMIYGMFVLIRRHKDLLWLLCIVIGMECLLGLSLGEYYTFRYNALSYADLQLGRRLEDMCGKSDRRVVSYGNNSEDQFISSIQFAMWDTEIYLVREDAFQDLREGDLVLVSATHGEVEKFSEYYAEKKGYGSFWLYYNP